MLGITKGAVSQITRKLLDKNLIEKIPSKERNNEVFISLTEAGRTVYFYHQDMHKDMLDKIDGILNDLSDEGKNALNAIIQVIDESLDTI